MSLALAPTLVAIAVSPGFTTQDGPAHIYSARILNASLGSGSPFAATFEVAWQPLPNWAGHLATMLAVAVCSPDVANRAITAVTLIGFAAAVVWLRWVVAGARGLGVTAIVAVVLGLNMTWLLGFTSFLLGASLAPITLAVWWSGRDEFGILRTAGLALLLVLGYFCHPISLGLTVFGLGILCLFTPGHAWKARLGWTVLSGLPLVPLGLAYRAMTRSGGGLEPVWKHWTGFTVRGFVTQLGWVDPLSLAAKTTSPFEVARGLLPPALLAPALWALIGFGVLTALTWSRRHSDRRGWLILAGCLIFGGLVAPDTLGVKHGHFLPQRIVLLGLVVLIPWLNFDLDRTGRRLAVATLGMALVIQSAFVWDYARTSRDRIAPFLRASGQLQAGDRAGTLLTSIRGRFRANPLLHADCLLASLTDSVFWTNYETAQYYFPVKVRAGVDHPIATEFEQIAILDQPDDAAHRADLWQSLLHRYRTQINKVVEWQTDPELDAVLRRDYSITFTDGNLRIWTRVSVNP